KWSIPEIMAIHLIQLLCPDRHCILAVAYDDQLTTYAKTQKTFSETVASLLERRALNSFCGLCRSTEWHYEDGKTSFNSMAQAETILMKAEADQRASAALFKQYL